MNTRTIKIFLASSEELEDDRNAFGNLVRRLDKIYVKRGMRIELFEWEDYDAAYNDRRKQDEYNDNVRASDMFLALFHMKAGKFTIEEFDVATEEFKRTGKSPKCFVYCRDLKDGEHESEDLKEFKARLFEEMGHYWSRYGNRDSMQLHFVMQLQLVEGNFRDDLKLEGGDVQLCGETIAKMDKLQFAAGNEDYVKMSEELAALPPKIEKARMRLEKFPDDEDLVDDLQQKLNRYNILKEEFGKYQKLLFDTAKRITQLQGDRITDRMRRAMDAFENGNVREANIILDEAEHDAERNLSDYVSSREITEQKRQNVIHSIEELLLKTSTVMADASMPIEERIQKTSELYVQAEKMAVEVDYDKEKYYLLLYGYVNFLYEYAFYEDALDYYDKLLDVGEEILAEENADTAIIYNNIGLIYYRIGEYNDALKWYKVALDINNDAPEITVIYNNIGLAYYDLGKYDEALEYYEDAVEICKNMSRGESLEIATCYNNIGLVYYKLYSLESALSYFSLSLDLYKKFYGEEHPEVARVYNNIALIYYANEDENKTMEYFEKALSIYRSVYGEKHPDIAQVYINIGDIYNLNIGDDEIAIEYYFKAYDVLNSIFGETNVNMARAYDKIGSCYDDMGEYDKALEFLLKAMKIREDVLGTEHTDTAETYSKIGMFYEYSMKEYINALKYYEKAYIVFMDKLGENHPDTLAIGYGIEEIKTKIAENN